MAYSEFDIACMRRALALAAQGRGSVEPNPMVGCVVARGERVIGEGWHRRFGGAHAEIDALATLTEPAVGAALYVTLEPCCHQGKTPPCTEAILQAAPARVVVALVDPFPAVQGAGVARLRQAGIAVEVGLLENEARRLNAPYLKLLARGRPWVIAKWAMSLDGRIAARCGDSRWISNEASRRVVHALRGRMDAIVVGRGTAAADDPQLTARPPGARVPTRIVLDSAASLASSSRLVQTVRETPVLVAAGPHAAAQDLDRLRQAGCEALIFDAADHAGRFGQLLDELGRRRMTNLLVEGGAQVLGTLFDARLIDEFHVFIAPKLIGGSAALGPLGGLGSSSMAAAIELAGVETQMLDGDVYVTGRIPTPD